MTLIAWAAWIVGVLGFGLLIGGIALIHIPGALIVAGLAMVGWAYLADKAAATQQRKPPPGGG